MLLGKNIRTARERMRPVMTQERLGEILGVSSQAVSQWEKWPRKGGTRPDIDKLPEIAKALEVSVDWLVTGHEAALDPEGPWTLWKLLKPAQRPLAISLLKTLVDQTGDHHK